MEGVTKPAARALAGIKIVVAALLIGSSASLVGQERSITTPDEALEALREGNLRYRRAAPLHPHQTADYRVKLSQEQHPFTQVLACSDSRTAPEIIFDEGLGDLFVVRVAGNIVDDAVKGSLEYGAEHLHTPLIVVLGHSGCGAVTAAVEAVEAHDHIVSLMDAIFPAVLTAREQPGDLLSNAVRANVVNSVDILRRSWPTLHKMSQAGEIRVVGAVYDLKTGAVEFLDH